MNLEVIDHLTKNFADARAELSDAVAKLNDKIEALKRQALPAIKAAVAKAAAHKNSLHSAVFEYPNLFERPRTQVFHGIKVGYRKGIGGIDWDDDARVVKLIRANFPKPQADLLIKTTEKPITKALADLDTRTLKTLGCRVEDTGDEIVIKPTDSDVDKIVTALLAEATAEPEAA